MGGAWPRETLATFGSTGTGVLVLQKGRGGMLYFRGGNGRCHCSGVAPWQSRQELLLVGNAWHEWPMRVLTGNLVGVLQYRQVKLAAIYRCVNPLGQENLKFGLVDQLTKKRKRPDCHEAYGILLIDDYGTDTSPALLLPYRNSGPPCKCSTGTRVYGFTQYRYCERRCTWVLGGAPVPRRARDDLARPIPAPP